MFDILIVGSGPAGVSAAFPLVEAGLSVLMVDGGSINPDSYPKEDLLTWRQNNSEQYLRMIGEDFYSLKSLTAASPKLRVPAHRYVFQGFNEDNKIIGEDFLALGSLAPGGLSNAWGCGVAKFSKKDFEGFPFSEFEIEDSYRTVATRMGISGPKNDELSEYFGLDSISSPPIYIDRIHSKLLSNYSNIKNHKKFYGFKMAQSRMAVLGQDKEGRKACNLCGNCFWGCDRKSMYSAVEDLKLLKRNSNFHYETGIIIDELKKIDVGWKIRGYKKSNKNWYEFEGKKVVLAAGTLTTSSLVLKTLGYEGVSIQMQSCPTAAFMVWLPSALGYQADYSFALGQLSYTLNLDSGLTGYGSLFNTAGIPLSEFVRHSPLKMPLSIDFFRNFLTSCMLGVIFYPGSLSSAQLVLNLKGELKVSGGYNDKTKRIIDNSKRNLEKIFWKMGALLLPQSFRPGIPGSDIHYSCTFPMKHKPTEMETNKFGELPGLKGLFLVDGSSLSSLPAKSHTLTIMANADRIGRQISQLSRLK